MKRTLSLILALCVLLGLAACGAKKKTVTADDIPTLVASLSLQQKAEQMVQADENSVNNFNMLKYNALGSLLTTGSGLDDNFYSSADWAAFMDGVQQGIMEQENNVIPMFYGLDVVHGVIKYPNGTIFPHNIGIGAANDPDLTYQMGLAIAEEMKLGKIHLAFSPCVAAAQDPRWGRTYESFSSDTSIVSALGEAYTKGLLDGGVQPCAKHYIGDGATEYGTSSTKMLDQGNADMEDDELESLLEPYRAQVDAGVNFIMPSYSSINGVKNHANYHLLTEVLRGELGFEGVVLSDYEAVNGLGKPTVEENVAIAVNAGVDMLMGAGTYANYIRAIVKDVENGIIPEERVDEAVTRILTVKQKMGLFDDPYWNKKEHSIEAEGCEENRALAKELVSSSLVLLKNENDILPLKSGTTVLVIGPAANDVGVQCGGWTATWSGQTDAEAGRVMQGTSILEGLEAVADEYGLTILTDESRADEADVVLLCVGEKPYQEFYGDDPVIDLITKAGHGLDGNAAAIRAAYQSGKPTVTLIVAGRNVMISNLINYWDGCVMCYLPGTEGDGVAANLVGAHPFTGKLPMPWYNSISDITADEPELLFELGYGLSF